MAKSLSFDDRSTHAPAQTYNLDVVTHDIDSYLYIYPFGATLLTLMETHNTDISLQEDYGSDHRDLLLVQ